MCRISVSKDRVWPVDGQGLVHSLQVRLGVIKAHVDETQHGWPRIDVRLSQMLACLVERFTGSSDHCFHGVVLSRAHQMVRSGLQLLNRRASLLAGCFFEHGGILDRIESASQVRNVSSATPRAVAHSA